MRYLSKRFYIFSLLVLLVAIPVVGATFFYKGINLGTNDEDELKGDIKFVSNRTDKRDEIEALINEFEKLLSNKCGIISTHKFIVHDCL